MQKDTNIVAGVELAITQYNHSEKTVSVLHAANKLTTEHIKSTLPPGVRTEQLMPAAGGNSSNAENPNISSGNRQVTTRTMQTNDTRGLHSEHSL